MRFRSLPGRDQYAWETSVAEQSEKNVQVHDGVSQEEFIQLRNDRDAEPGMPKLILPAIQVNIRAAHLPPPEDNDISYLKVPLNRL